MKKIMKETDAEMIRAAFKVFDKDGNGIITAAEFKLFMVKHPTKMHFNAKLLGSYGYAV